MSYNPLKSLFCGIFAIFGLSLLIIFLTKYFTYKKFQKELSLLSEAQPKKILFTQISPFLAKQAKKKYFTLKKNLINKEKTSVEFSLAEINSLIQFEERFSKIKNKVRFFIKNNKIFAQISFPINWLNKFDKKLKYHFINGEAEFYLYMKKKLIGHPFLFFALKSFKTDLGKLFSSLSFASEYNIFGFFAYSKQEYIEIENLLGLVKAVKVKSKSIELRNY